MGAAATRFGGGSPKGPPTVDAAPTGRSAGLNYVLSNYSQAIRLFNSCLDIKRNLGDRGGEARTLNNLGLVADAQGDYETAREYFEAGLEISREIGAIWPTLQILDNLVYTRDFKESEESAIEWCRTALSIIDDSGLDLTDEREIFESYLDELQGSGE